MFQAARETGALKEAKDKLEKHVEELTWRLQLEKRLRVISCFLVWSSLFMGHLVQGLFGILCFKYLIASSFKVKLFVQTDLEEAKAQEIVKLQNTVQALQTKVDESNAELVKEREAAKKAIEEAPPVIKETQVFVEDTKKVDSLTSEVENLKV